MVVVPTSTHVELSYGLTTADWAGRAITVGGAVGLVLLGLWTGARRFAAGDDEDRAGEPDARRDEHSGDDSHDAEAPSTSVEGERTGPSEDEPPDRKEPEPALP
jgi:hypothetical protein